MITISMAVTAAAVTMAIASRRRRLPRRSGVKAEIAAATMSGVTVARARRWSTAVAL
jgi:hypothetical protein